MTDGNNPAFPKIVPDGDPIINGVTIREYFAAMAMQVFIASYAGMSISPNPEFTATKAVEYADMLIHQLNK